ncbi:TPA: hypothetical protein GXZ34_03155 [bacterium]|nr:hypothetical protein [bacterium]
MMYIYTKLIMLASKGALFLEGVTGDEDLDNQINVILDLIKGPLMLVIYLGLGALLTVKGAMLGTQIVKAADEPQIRQEKINSLKYLVIGVAIAFGVAFIAQQLVSYFQTTLGVTPEA